jgi:hypothetical protein
VAQVFGTHSAPRLSHFHRTPAREERGLSWSAGLIVDRFGKPVEGRLELVMVDDRQVVQHLGMTER